MKIQKNEYESIINRVKKGEIYRTIAEDYKVSVERIRQILKEEKVYIRSLDVRREAKLMGLLTGINEKSKELFFYSGFNTTDLVTECFYLYKIKRICAVKTGVPFDVAFNGITWNRFCPLTNKEINYFTDRCDPAVPSIELINPNGGYVNGNVHIVLKFRKSSFNMV